MLLAQNNHTRLSTWRWLSKILLLLVLFSGCTGGSTTEPPVAFNQAQQDSLRQVALNSTSLKALFAYCKYQTKDSLFTTAVRKNPSIQTLHEIPVLEFPMPQSQALLEDYFNIQVYEQLKPLPFWSIDDPFTKNRAAIRYFWASPPSKKQAELVVLKRLLRTSPEVVRETSTANLQLIFYFPAEQREMQLYWTAYKAPYDSVANKGTAMNEAELALFLSYLEQLTFDSKAHTTILQQLYQHPNATRSQVKTWLPPILKDRTYTLQNTSLSTSTYVPYFLQTQKPTPMAASWQDQALALQINEIVLDPENELQLDLTCQLNLHHYYKKN